MNLKLYKFLKPNSSENPVSTQDVISSVRDTEASSVYIFQPRIHTCKHLYSNNLEIIQRIIYIKNQCDATWQYVY